MKKKICVFCSSSDSIANIYYKATDDLAALITENHDELVYGGSDVGLMKRLAEKVKSEGGKVTGIIPQKIYDKNLAFKYSDKLIIAPDMQSRKKKLIEEADAFIIMPGGFGTVDELMDVISEKQLQYHDKPIVLINIEGFYNPLINFFEQLFQLHFAKFEFKNLYFVTDNINEAFHYINNYKGATFSEKWF